MILIAASMQTLNKGLLHASTYDLLLVVKLTMLQSINLTLSHRAGWGGLHESVLQYSLRSARRCFRE